MLTSQIRWHNVGKTLCLMKLLYDLNMRYAKSGKMLHTPDWDHDHS